jgi:16S rRNA (guanine(966)-N(2))-methyltransferase RsmD
MGLRLSGGRKLQSPPGDTARPTPSRVRLAVMNMLSAELPGARWLDLCCGSGVMGCEALQRGAAEVVAVDQDRRMAATARGNLELVASGQTPTPAVQVVTQDVLRWLRQGASTGSAGNPANRQGFHLIYADPPYAAGLYGPITAAVAEQGWLRDNGLLLLECSSSEVPERPPGWMLLKQRRYGGSTVLVLRQARETDDQPDVGGP